MTRRAVFLDRDGVLNRAIVRAGKPFPPLMVADVEVLPDVPEALQLLRTAGFELIVVTNQPDVSRGITQRNTVDQINEYLMKILDLDIILTCFHDNIDNCDCRKPRPGLLLKMRDERGLDMARSFMVGDRWRDVEVGCNAGCRTIFIDRGYDEKWPGELADYVCDSLGDAARWIVTNSHP